MTSHGNLAVLAVLGRQYGQIINSTAKYGHKSVSRRLATLNGHTPLQLTQKH